MLGQFVEGEPGVVAGAGEIAEDGGDFIGGALAVQFGEGQVAALEFDGGDDGLGGGLPDGEIVVEGRAAEADDGNAEEPQSDENQEVGEPNFALRVGFLLFLAALLGEDPVEGFAFPEEPFHGRFLRAGRGLGGVGGGGAEGKGASGAGAGGASRSR